MTKNDGMHSAEHKAKKMTINDIKLSEINDAKWSEQITLSEARPSYSEMIINNNAKFQPMNEIQTVRVC